MPDLDPTLLIHLRGTGEEGFTMPPRTAAFSALGLRLPAARVIEETRFQQRRGALVVGPPGCGKSAWLARLGAQCAAQRPLCRVDPRQTVSGRPEAGALVLIDDWDAGSAAQHAQTLNWLDRALDADPDLDVIVATASDELAMALAPDRWLEFQWAPPPRTELDVALGDWAPARRAALLDCLADPALAMLARRPVFWSHWPQSPPGARARLLSWLDALGESCGAAGQECRALLARWQAPARPLRWQDLRGGPGVVGSPPDETGRWTDESPRTTVRVAPLALADTPLTNAQFLAGRSEADAPPPWWGDTRYAGPDQPLTGLSQPQALAHARGRGCTLPSEAQWEYACRAGSDAARYHEDAASIAWYAANSGYGLHPVGGLMANAFGLYDMLGLCWEWTLDHCHDSHRDTPRDGSAWTGGDGHCHMLRGGSWADKPRVVRAATRLKGHPGPRVANIGFRLARPAGDGPGL